MEFTILTDHNPFTWLNWITGENGHLLRRSLAIQPFNFTIQKGGSQHTRTDGLSCQQITIKEKRPTSASRATCLGSPVGTCKIKGGLVTGNLLPSITLLLSPAQTSPYCHYRHPVPSDLQAEDFPLFSQSAPGSLLPRYACMWIYHMQDTR